LPVGYPKWSLCVTRFRMPLTIVIRGGRFIPKNASAAYAADKAEFTISGTDFVAAIPSAILAAAHRLSAKFDLAAAIQPPFQSFYMRLYGHVGLL
jgi:hypothetical protein